MKKESSTPLPPGRKPVRFERFANEHPDIARAFESLGIAVQEAGPLDAHTSELVKLALSVGASREGAVHSHTRRALEAGCSPDEIRHVVLLAIITIGFPGAMAAMSWVDDVLRASGAGESKE